MHGSTQHESRPLASPSDPHGLRIVHARPLCAALVAAELALLSPAYTGTRRSLFQTIDLTGQSFTEERGTNPTRPGTTQRCRHTLCEAIASAEQGGDIAVGARLEQNSGGSGVRVELVQRAEPEHPSSLSFVVWRASLTSIRWLPSRQSCLHSSTIAQLQVQRSALARTDLCLLEATSLAECLADGEVQSVVPVLRHDQPYFLVTIRESGGLFRVCLLDPAPSDFCPDP